MKHLDSMPIEHREVYDAIANAPNKYITRNSILAQLNKSESYTRKLVDIIHSLVVDYNLPVGASADKYRGGYFIIRNEADKALAVKTLTSRISGIQKRADALRNLSVEDKE